MIARAFAGIAVLLLLLPLSARAEIIISYGPTPAGATLALIASGRATPELLSEQIVAGAEKHWSYPLMPRLLEVLAEFSREGPAQESAVLDAFLLAEKSATTENGRKLIAKSLDSLKGGGAETKTVTHRSGWFQHDAKIPLDVPITRRSQGDWPIPVFADRIESLLDGLLPKEDRRLYVKQALEAFLSPDCGAFLGGRAASVCEEVGLFPMQYHSLRLAFGGLFADGRDPGVAEIYLSQDPRTLDAVIGRDG